MKKIILSAILMGMLALGFTTSTEASPHHHNPHGGIHFIHHDKHHDSHSGHFDRHRGSHHGHDKHHDRHRGHFGNHRHHR